MTPLPTDRRRLIEALGLGPVWVRRTIAERVDPTDADAQALQAMVSSGRACGLRGSRIGEFSSAGVPRPHWLVIAAPALDDDAHDERSADPARRLLDAMLAAIGLSRDRTVLVTSLSRCRTHATGTAIGRAWLERQIELLAPRIILVVGDVAMAALFPGGNAASFFGRQHGLTIAGRDIPVVATLHPLRLLDDGAAKARVWADLCLARTIHEAMTATAT